MLYLRVITALEEGMKRGQRLTGEKTGLKKNGLRGMMVCVNTKGAGVWRDFNRKRR